MVEYDDTVLEVQDDTVHDHIDLPEMSRVEGTNNNQLQKPEQSSVNTSTQTDFEPSAPSRRRPFGISGSRVWTPAPGAPAESQIFNDLFDFPII